MTDLIKKSKINISKFLDAIDESDRIILINAINDDNHEAQDRIYKKYGYAWITPLEDVIDDYTCDLATKSLLSEGGWVNFESKMNSAINLKRGDVFGSEATNTHSKMSADEIIKECIRLDNKMSQDSSLNDFTQAIHGEEIDTLIKASIILNVIGCTSMRDKLKSVFLSMISQKFYSKAISSYNKKIIISEDRRKAGKGNASPHKGVALKIAKDTWDKYPNASQEGMTDELFMYFRTKWNDNPASGAIRGWLSDSKLNPDVKPKNRKFKLIIND